MDILAKPEEFVPTGDEYESREIYPNIYATLRYGLRRVDKPNRMVINQSGKPTMIGSTNKFHCAYLWRSQGAAIHFMRGYFAKNGIELELFCVKSHHWVLEEYEV